MTWTSRYGSLNRLVASLEATAVLSKDYTQAIIGDAIMACSEAYAAGAEAERQRVANEIRNASVPSGERWDRADWEAFVRTGA